jgi:hypothetical protein
MVGELMPHQNAKCDDGILRSVMAEGGAKGENLDQLSRRLKARLVNL